MPQINRILHASDLTSRADIAFERALLLQEQFDSELILLHVIEECLPQKIEARRRAEAGEHFQTRLMNLGDERQKKISVRIVVGHPYREITDEAIKLGAQFVIIGTHGRIPIKDLFLGTTAERTVRLSDAPILTVGTEPSEAYSRVLVAIDFSPSSRRALEAAESIAPGAKFRLVHACEASLQSASEDIFDCEEAIRIHKQEFFSSGHATLKPRDVSALVGEPTEAIRQEVKEFAPDLLVMGSHGRSGVVGSILGSVTRRLLANPPCDMLVSRA